MDMIMRPVGWNFLIIFNLRVAYEVYNLQQLTTQVNTVQTDNCVESRILYAYLSASELPDGSAEDSNEIIPVNVPRFQGEMVITCSAVFPGRTVTDDGPLKISRSVLT